MLQLGADLTHVTHVCIVSDNRRDGCVVRKFLPAVVLLLTTQQVLAQATCIAPVPPLPLDGAAASPEQLRAAIANARDFIGRANLYENCLRQQLHAAQVRAAGGSAVDRAVDRQTEVRIAANRRLKDKVSSDAARALEAYMIVHPR